MGSTIGAGVVIRDGATVGDGASLLSKNQLEMLKRYIELLKDFEFKQKNGAQP